MARDDDGRWRCCHLEWPLQQEVVGDPRGLRILDLGCGSGAKVVHWAHHGAAEVIGVDISGQFVPDPPGNVQLISGDLSDPDTLDEVRGRVYDRILFSSPQLRQRPGAHAALRS